MRSVSTYIPKLSLIIFVAALAILNVGGHAHADSYNNSNLIDNSIFVNSNTMSAQGIQTFLTSEGGSLAGYTDPTDGNLSAAQIIYNVSQHVGLNPQVIMATMQKEQSLVTDPDAGQGAYNCAMGYTSCSDDNTFYLQVLNGAWQLRFNYQRAGEAPGATDSWTSPDGTVWGNGISYPCANGSSLYNTGLYAGRSVTFSDDNGNPYTTITLANAATASLYCYTPYVYPGSSQDYYSGSYNFVEAFISWWGNVHVPSYSWSFGSQGAYTDSSKSTPLNIANMSPGQTGWLLVNAVNTGTATWYNSGANPVRLGTDQPEGRSSAFATNAWIAPSRPATMDQTSVAPGQTATFEFPFQVPNLANGTYDEYFVPLAEGAAWMNENVGQFFPITVNSNYSWSFGSQGAYTDSTKSTPLNIASMSPGQTGWLVVNAVNTGNATWSNTGPYPVRLGTDQPENRASRFATNAWIAPWRPATMDQASVAPGQTATFEFPIQVPPGGGTFREYFNPMVEGITWMNEDVGQFFPITVNSNYSWSFGGQGAYTDSSKSTALNLTTLTAGNTGWLTVSAVNTGNATWYNSGPYPMRLATDNPPDRTSRFATNAWIAPWRPATMDQASVAPGQTATFEFPISVPAGAGTYREYFNPLVEGYTRLNNNVGQFFLMTVH